MAIPRFLIPCILAAGPAVTLVGQSPQLAFDFNAAPRPLGSTPDTATAVRSGAWTYFWAETPAAGIELWRSDGTTAGTAMVRDIAPGPGSSAPDAARGFAREMVPFRVGGTDGVVFGATRANEGVELWFSDGSAAGTRLVADVFPGPESSAPSGFLALGGLVYFAATDGPSGRELWVSDGTRGGTRLVADIELGPGWSSPSGLTASPIAGELLFAASTAAVGAELFRSDGTSTTLLADLEPGTLGSRPGEFVRFGGQVLFVAGTVATGRELFATGGTTGSTALVADLDPTGSSSPILADSAVLGGRVYFAATDARGAELWSSDGTPAGTTLVDDIEPGPASSSPQELTNVGGSLVFSARTAAGGFEPHALLGGVAVPLADLNPGPAGSEPTWITAVGAGFVATVDTPSGSRELWSSTPTPQRLTAGTVVAPPVELPAGRWMLSIRDGMGAEPWVTDGTVSGTRRIADLVPGVGSGSTQFYSIGRACADRLFVTLDRVGSGPDQAWVYDPAVGATPLGLGTASRVLASTADVSLVASFDPALGYEPYVFGRAGAARLLRDIDPGTGGSQSPGIAAVVLGQQIVFMASDASGIEPWITDGTPQGTRQLADILPGPASSLRPTSTREIDQKVFAVFRGRAYFAAEGPGSGRELWATDGTTAGTVLVADLDPGPGSSWPEMLGVMNGRLWLCAFTPATGRELWSTDGTAAGTRLLVDLEPGPASSSPSEFVVAGDRAAFAAFRTPFGRELHATDGSAAGTVRLTDLAPGPLSSTFQHLVAAEDRAYFSWLGDLWVTDFTVPGTRSVGASVEVDNQPGSRFHAVGRRVMFAGSNALWQDALWESDGTAAGTRWVGSLAGLTGQHFQPFRGGVYGPLRDPVVGTELFRIDDPGALVEDLGDRCGPAWAELACTVPVLGGVLTVTGENAPASHLRVGVLADAATPRRPLPGQLAPGCFSHVIPGFGLFGIGVTMGSSWQAQLQVPNVASLSGLAFHLQAAFLPLSGAAGATSASNALRVTVGR